MRGYNWEYSVSVQHELMPKVSMTAGYYRRKFGNLRVNDNLNISPTAHCNPVQHRWAERPALPDRRRRINHDVQPQSDRKLGTPSDTLVTFST